MYGLPTTFAIPYPATTLTVALATMFFPKRLDRIFQLDLVTVDRDVEAPFDRFGDLRVGDCAEQLTVPPGLRGDVDRLALEQLRQRLRGGALLGFALGLRLLLLVERCKGALRGFDGELARQEVVPAVALGDLDDVALASQRLDILEQYD